MHSHDIHQSLKQIFRQSVFSADPNRKIMGFQLLSGNQFYLAWFQQPD